MIRFLIRHRNNRILGKLSLAILKIYGTEIHANADISKTVKFEHTPFGTVITDRVIIKDRVRIYHGVTLGKAEIFLPDKVINERIGHIIVEEGAILCAGAKILIKSGDIVIGRNTIIGANSVLTKSTGDNEIWAGIPARKIRDRIDEFMI